jgi:MOSC domain-containing protein YiiM
MSLEQSILNIATTWPVLRVQAGMLQELPFEGGTWQTAIHKTMLDGAVVVDHTGILGDEHTGSGPDPERAICCCPIDHYTHWRSMLGLELPLGIFGENLTLARVTEAEVCIGDILHCGNVVLQVSQPRMPCYKQARRIGRPDFVKQIMQSGRLGFLLRVLTPGTFQAGDALTLVDRPHPHVSVATVVRAFRTPVEQPDPHQLDELTLLAPEWRNEFARRRKSSDPSMSGITSFS